MDHKYISYAGLKRIFYTKILKLINLKIDKTNGDISNTKVRSVDAISTEFPDPVVGESTKTFLGKVKKCLADWKAIKSTLLTLSMLTNQYENSTSKIPTAAPVYALKQSLDTTNSNLSNKVDKTGGTLTGNLTIQKDTPIYEAMVTSTSKGRFIKNAGGGVDYGTELIDISGNVQTNLTVTNGKLRLVKRVDGVITGSVDVASIP